MRNDIDSLPAGTVLTPEEAGIPPEPAPTGGVTPTPDPAITGQSTIGSAIRGAESGALSGFNEKAAAGIDTFVSHHPWIADLASKVSGDETLRDPSLTYDQRLERYKQAAAESLAKHPVATIGGTIAGAALPSVQGGVARIATKGGEALAERALGASAGRVARVLAPAAEGAGLGALNAMGEDIDIKHGAELGGALGLTPTALAAFSGPLARLVKNVPYIGGAISRIKPVQGAANALGLGIADTKAEASRLLSAAEKDPVVSQAVLHSAPSAETANTLAQHTVDLKNKLVATTMALPAKASAGLRASIGALEKAVEAGDVKGIRLAGEEAAKEAARIGLSADEQENIHGQIKALDTAARLAVATVHSVPHMGGATPMHPFFAAQQGNLGPAATEAAMGRPGMARAVAAGAVKMAARPVDRAVARFIHAGETGETGPIQEQARELMTKPGLTTRSLLSAVQAREGHKGESEPVNTMQDIAEAMRKLGSSDDDIAGMLGAEAVGRGEGKKK